MKKTMIVLAVVSLLAVSMFAETGVCGELMFGLTDAVSTDASTAVIKAEVNVNADVDEYTSVSVELDMEGTDWTDNAVSVDDFRIDSNVSGALGIDAFDLTLTAGYFDTYFCNWNYVTRSGEEYYSSNPAGSYLWTSQPTTDMAFAVDLGLGDYSLQYWMDMYATNMSVAFSGTPVDGTNFLLGYSGAMDDLANGNLWVEGGYSFDAGSIALFVPASFAYDMDDTDYGWSSGVAADIDAMHFSVGVGGASDTAVFKDCIVEVSTSVVENADVYAIADMDFSADTVFQSIDVGGKYNLGALGLGAGYVIASSDTVSTSVWSDSSSMSGSGLYLFCDIDF